MRAVVISLTSVFWFTISKVGALNLRMAVGKNSILRGRLVLGGGGSLSIGESVHLNSNPRSNPTGIATCSKIVCERGATITIGAGSGISNSVIYARVGIYIGKNVLIGTDCKVYDTDFHSVHLADRVAVPEVGARSAPIAIEDGVFIGTGCTILKGSRIGRNSVIQAMSLVRGNIPENELWGGNPCRFLRKIPLRQS